MKHENTKAGVCALTPCRWSEKRNSSNLTREPFSFQVFDLNARKLFEFSSCLCFCLFPPPPHTPTGPGTLAAIPASYRMLCDLAPIPVIDSTRALIRLLCEAQARRARNKCTKGPRNKNARLAGNKMQEWQEIKVQEWQEIKVQEQCLYSVSTVHSFDVRSGHATRKR